MNTTDLTRIGVPPGDALKLANSHMRRLFAQGLDRAQVESEIIAIVADPQKFATDPLVGDLARALDRPAFTPREIPAPWKQWAPDWKIRR